MFSLKTKYCPKCGGDGIDINGNPCTCGINVSAIENTISCIDVPQQYLGIKFRKEQVPTDCGESYVDYLATLHSKLINMQFNNYNLCICSPIAHSKTIMAYDVINELFHKRINTFPVCNVYEVQSIFKTIDNGTPNEIEYIRDPQNFLKAPYIFVKIPLSTTWLTYSTVVDILDRRVRRGLSTIFLFDDSWDALILNDKRDLLSSLKGNGYYNTIDVKSWYKANRNDEEAFKTIINRGRLLQ